MSDLSPETDKLLELARGASTLSAARREQIKAGLLSQIAAGGALGAAATHAVWGKAAWLSSPLAKGISVLALLSVVGAGVYIGVRAPKPEASAAPNAAAPAGVRAQPQSPATSEGPSAERALDKAQGRPSAGEPSPVGPSSNHPNLPASASAVPGAAPSLGSGGGASAAAAVARAASSASHGVSANDASSGAPQSADTLGAETRLLRDADQALRAGNAGRALALLDEHAARYPHGVLEPERSAERMIARCKLGQVDAKTARSYLASHASSSFAARLQDACGSVSH